MALTRVLLGVHNGPVLLILNVYTRKQCRSNDGADDDVVVDGVSDSKQSEHDGTCRSVGGTRRGVGGIMDGRAARRLYSEPQAFSVVLYLYIHKLWHTHTHTATRNDN